MIPDEWIGSGAVLCGKLKDEKDCSAQRGPMRLNEAANFMLVPCN